MFCHNLHVVHDLFGNIKVNILLKPLVLVGESWYVFKENFGEEDGGVVEMIKNDMTDNMIRKISYNFFFLFKSYTF